MIFLPPTQPLEPVHVIVDHIATTPGLPVWLTTTISAGVGAIFGIVSGTLMEFVRSWNVHRSEKRNVKRLLTNEITDDLNHIEEFIDVITRYLESNEEPVEDNLRLSVRAISDDLYRESIEKHRAIGNRL